MTTQLIHTIDDKDLEGVVSCYCGAKHWENLMCFFCGEKISNRLLAQLRTAR